MSKAMQAERKMWSKFYTYDEWMEAQGFPFTGVITSRI